ncbi:MAG TPA: SRPBCC domain-containing protein [Steroidobacteraceae bacterium]|nr:SRPBCC domain-containing protein [Steroidobacteraceae bacterium]
MAARSTERRAAVAAPDERDIVITRVVEAPRALVYQAWTTREHVVHWWRPKGFASVDCDEFEARRGGRFGFTMKLADGTRYTSRCVFGELVPPESLSYDEECFENGKLFHRAHQDVRFESIGARTLITLKGRLDGVADRDARFTIPFMREGWTAGWNENLDELEPYLAKITGSLFELTREIDAPRELVFDAWTDPKQLAEWWGPRIMKTPVCQIDLRVGGAYRIVMRAPDGTDYPMTGVYREIDRPRRLAMTMDCSEHPRAWHDLVKPGRAPGDDNPAGVMQGVFTFEDRGGKTLLTIRMRMASAEIRDAMAKMGMNEGWSESLERLAELTRGVR